MPATTAKPVRQPSLNRGPLLSTQPPSQPPTPQAGQDDLQKRYLNWEVQWFSWRLSNLQGGQWFVFVFFGLLSLTQRLRTGQLSACGSNRPQGENRESDDLQSQEVQQRNSSDKPSVFVRTPIAIMKYRIESGSQVAVMIQGSVMFHMHYKMFLKKSKKNLNAPHQLHGLKKPHTHMHMHAKSCKHWGFNVLSINSNYFYFNIINIYKLEIHFWSFLYYKWGISQILDIFETYRGMTHRFERFSWRSGQELLKKAKIEEAAKGEENQRNRVGPEW